MRAGRAAGRVTGRTGGAAWQRVKAVSRGNAAQLARRAERWLLIRGLASAAVRPHWWAAVGAVVVLFSPLPWPLALITLSAYALTPGLAICDHWRSRSPSILSAVSRRVKSLKLARRLRSGWLPEMTRLGLSQQRQRRDKTITVVPQLGRVQVTEWGVCCDRVSLRQLGLPVDALAKFDGHLASAYAVPYCSITEVTSGIARLEMRHSDPLATPVRVEDLPEPRRRLHVVTRITEEGEPLEQDVVLPHLVIGGQGSGKSTDLWTYLYQLQQAGIPFRARVFDPKGGMELGDLRDAAYMYESGAAGWPRFLGKAMDALYQRQQRLARRGWRNLTRFTDAEPLDVMVIDELLA